MDFLLLAIAFWMVVVARGLGGVVGKSMGLVTVGAVVLGLAHLSETVLFEYAHVAADAGEVIHRVIILLGFVFLTLGLGAATKVLKKKPASEPSSRPATSVG
ncbi:MAG TPA: hypothetical protein VKB27_20870 [Gammaproteobacteria bacterium]|nr:hypothetical protein [Gammaproteobacteria bacterium]